VINNVDVAIAETPDALRDALLKQLYSPVRWVETIQCMAQKGVDNIIECGPGNVLTGLIKRINRDIKGYLSDNPSRIEAIKTIEE